MAKDKKGAKDKGKDKAEGGKKAKVPKNPGRGGQVLLVFGLIAAVIFLPTTIVLLVGMMPTIAALILNFNTGRSKVFGIGAMNLSGAVPFLVELWKDGQGFDKALEIIKEPKSIIVMYAAAGLGYLINWAMGGIVGSVLYETAKGRRKDIERRKQELIERWGEEVTGQMALDAQGFPLGMGEPTEEPATT